MDRVARRGLLARAPGALTSHNAEKLKGGPFEEKNFEKNPKKMSRSAEKK